jgi:hypothetical protein
MNDELITLAEAAQRAGYRSTSTLRTAAIEGTLKTRRISDRVRLTTPAWLDEYLASLRHGKPGKGYRRGQPRKGDAATGTAGE